VITLKHVIGSALVIAHIETLRADGTLVNPLPVYVSDQLPQLVIVRTVDKHVRFYVSNRGDDLFRRQSTLAATANQHFRIPTQPVISVVNGQFFLFLLSSNNPSRTIQSLCSTAV